MRLFFDSSALLKRYLNENGSESVTKLIASCSSLIVSSITCLECRSAFKRLYSFGEIEMEIYQKLNKELTFDFPFFEEVEYHPEVREISFAIIEKYAIKPLDCIQLSSLLYASRNIDYFVVCDQQLKKFALSENIKIIDPTE